MNEPDFKIRNLSDYPVEDLSTLFSACDIARKCFYNAPDDEKENKILDVWMYRLKGALKEARSKTGN